jgi:hypothetical protein
VFSRLLQLRWHLYVALGRLLTRVLEVCSSAEKLVVWYEEVVWGGGRYYIYFRVWSADVTVISRIYWCDLSNLDIVRLYRHCI